MTFSSPLCTAPDGGSCPHLHFTGHRFWDLLTLAMQPTPNDILNLLILPPPPPSYLPEKHHGKLDDVSTLSSPRPGVWERPSEHRHRPAGAADFTWINRSRAASAPIVQQWHKQGRLCTRCPSETCPKGANCHELHHQRDEAAL